MLRKILVSAAWVTGMNVFNMLAGFLFTIAVIRQIDPPAFGSYILGVLYAENLSFFLLLNFGLAVIQYDREQYGKEVIDTAAFLVRANGSILAGIGIVVFLFLITRGVDILTVAAFSVFLFVFLGGYAARLVFCLREKELDFKRQTIVMWVSVWAALGVAIVVFYAGFHIWSLIAREVTRTVIILWAIRKDLRIYIKPGFNRDIGRRLTSFSLKRQVIKVMEVAYFRTPMLLAGASVGKADLGRFAVAYKFGGQIKGFFETLIDKLGVSSYSYDPEKRKDVLLGSSYLLTRTFLVLYMILVVFGDNIFLFVFGPKWAEAYPLFSSLVPFILLLPVILNINAYFWSKNYLWASMAIWGVTILILWSLMLVRIDVASLAQWYSISAVIFYLLFVVFLIRWEKSFGWFPAYIFMGPLLIGVIGEVRLLLVFLVFDVTALYFARGKGLFKKIA